MRDTGRPARGPATSSLSTPAATEQTQRSAAAGAATPRRHLPAEHDVDPARSASSSVRAVLEQLEVRARARGSPRRTAPPASAGSRGGSSCGRLSSRVAGRRARPGPSCDPTGSAAHPQARASSRVLTSRRDSPRKLICIGERRAAASARAMRGGRGRPQQVGDEVEVVAHLQLAVVADVDGALRQAAVQRRDAGARQVVGMDVVRVDVVVGARAPACRARSALARIAAGAIERVDAGHAQQA